MSALELRPTILVVDDDEVFRTRLCRALEKRGYETRQAGDGESALLSAQEDSPERVVLDMRMPNSDGLTVLGELKKIDSSTQIVVLTGYGSIAGAVAALRLGARNYLSKPADADDILRAFEVDDDQRDLPRDAPSLARVEWEHIQRVLHDCDGNISQAARVLGIHRRSLQRKLAKYPAAR